MKPYLEAIDRMSYYEELTRSSDDWKKLIAYTPQEKRARKWFKMSDHGFQKKHLGKGGGQGGIFAAYLDHDLTVLPYITTGKTDATSRSGQMKNIPALRIYLPDAYPVP